MNQAAAARKISILIVDDHPLLREGIAAVLAAEPDMIVIGEAGNGREAISLFRELQPDVTLMDIQMPEMDGVSATEAMRAERSDAKVIVLTTYKGDVQALRALKAGAMGYLLKNLIRTDLMDAIRAVNSGGRYIPRQIADDIAAHVTDDLLSMRELQVLKCIATGNTNRRIAEQLFISEDTVKAHIKNIMSKLFAKDRTHAVTIAIKRGIIDLT